MIETFFFWLGSVLLGMGAFFLLSGVVGFLRFSGFFSRLHAAGVADSLGLPFILLGLVCYAGLDLASIKLLLLIIFCLFAAPTACHALAKAAMHSSPPPEYKKEEDAP